MNANAYRQQNLPAAISLLSANAAMGILQTCVASLFYLISAEFHETVYGLGILTSVFFVCYGIFEIFGGILATRIGPKNLVTLGTSIIVVSTLTCYFSPNFLSLVLLRVVSGVGFGMFFPPVLVL